MKAAAKKIGPRYWIGIDPGTKTGLAVWDAYNKRFECIGSMLIHKAMLYVKQFAFEHGHDNVIVRLEDARKRTWFGDTGKERMKGAGSIERDCSIWQDFLDDNKIQYMLVHPKNVRTKLPAMTFQKITGWKEQTNEHSRDAAMMVYGI
jgi:hypothetical protein